jgi:hypothetical protein
MTMKPFRDLRPSIKLMIVVVASWLAAPLARWLIETYELSEDIAKLVTLATWLAYLGTFAAIRIFVEEIQEQARRNKPWHMRK